MTDRFRRLYEQHDFPILQIRMYDSAVDARTLAKYYDADPRPALELTTECQGEPRLLVGESGGLRELGWEPHITLFNTLAMQNRT